MARHKNGPLRIAALFMLVLGFLLFVSCRNRMQDIRAVAFQDTFPVESASDVEMIYSDSAVIKALMKSPVVNRYSGDNPYVIMPKGITVFFYDSAMRVKTKLTAGYAIKYEKSDMMEARNDVVVVNRIGEKLNTEHLVWNQKSQKISSDVLVKITQPDRILLGNGMDADESFEKWKIRKPSGTLYIKMDEETNADGSKP
jgi:LPS export ABC transporter protein LptC